MLRLFPVLSICVLLFISAATTACGYKDDLYLPEPGKTKPEKQPKKS